MPAESPEEISLNVGESTEVKLKGLGTAGYKWNYSIQNNADSVSISKDLVATEKTAQKNIGASADEVFTIKAVSKGNINIYFFQNRSWEKNENPANEKRIKVIIQ